MTTQMHGAGNGSARAAHSAQDQEREQAEAGLDVEAALAESEELMRDVIRTHPVACVLGAAAVGFVLARLLRDA